MTKKFLLILFFILLSTPLTFAQENQAMNTNVQRHAGFTKLLSEYVNAEGLVNYRGFCNDDGFQPYLNDLSSTEWQRLGPDDELAFWINAYNAFTIKAICDHYPVDSINDLHTGGLIFGTAFNATIWDQEFFTVNGEPLSLGHIEHKILRKGPEKARIHFAIVCAAKSCPPLRQEAYEGGVIDEQLNEQAYAFLRRQDLNVFDFDAKKAYLSRIFKWFLKDFGDNKKELLVYLSRYAPSHEMAESLQREPKQWKIRWKKYDWSLNDLTVDR